jgi:hypothetical protein
LVRIEREGPSFKSALYFFDYTHGHPSDILSTSFHASQTRHITVLLISEDDRLEIRNFLWRSISSRITSIFVSWSVESGCIACPLLLPNWGRIARIVDRSMMRLNHIRNSISGKSRMIAKVSVSWEYCHQLPCEERNGWQLTSFCDLDQSPENTGLLGKGRVPRQEKGWCAERCPFSTGIARSCHMFSIWSLRHAKAFVPLEYRERQRELMMR